MNRALSGLLRRATFFGLSIKGCIVVTMTYMFLFLTVGGKFRPLLLMPVTFNVLLIGVCPSVVMDPRRSDGKMNNLLCCFCALSR